MTKIEYSALELAELKRHRAAGEITELTTAIGALKTGLDSMREDIFSTLDPAEYKTQKSRDIETEIRLKDSSEYGPLTEALRDTQTTLAKSKIEADHQLQVLKNLRAWMYYTGQLASGV